MSLTSVMARAGLALIATMTGLVAFTTPADATVAPTSTVITATATATPLMDPTTYRKRVHYWINRKRVQHGLNRVRFNWCPNKFATNWSSYLATNNDFYHQSLTPILNQCNAYYAGETLARGFISPRTTVRLWMQSPEHRQILLSKYPNKVGIGASVDSEGRWLTAADFVKKP